MISSPKTWMLVVGSLSLENLFVDQSQIIQFWSNATDFLGVKRPGDTWENVPSDLWVDIGKQLTSRLDILRFRSVCKMWRSSLPCPTRFPLWVPPPPQESPDVPYFITEVNMFQLRCKMYPQMWPLLVAFEEFKRGGKTGNFRSHIFMPRPDFFDCPTISSMAKPPLSKLTFIAKAYHLRLKNFQGSVFVRKIVLISSDATSVNPSYASDVTVVAHLCQGEMKGRLALLRLQGSHKNWYWDTEFNSRVYEDIATYKGQLCTLDKWGRVFFMDYNSLQMTQVCDSSSISSELKEKQLCESNEDLCLVDLNHRDNKGYKLSLRHRKWFQLRDVGWNILLAPGPYQIR